VIDNFQITVQTNAVPNFSYQRAQVTRLQSQQFFMKFLKRL
jgi:hypothetical protein